MRLTIRACFIAFIAFLLPACALTSEQVKGVNKFAKATDATSTAAMTELPKMRAMLIEANVARLRLNEQMGLPPEHADGSEIEVNDLDEVFDYEALEDRVKALETLRAYGMLLTALANADESKNLKSASSSLADSIDSLSDEFGTEISDEQKTAIASAVEGIGKWIVGYKKARATKKAVHTYHAQIVRIAELLRDDFDYNTGNRLASRTAAAQGELMVLADDAIRCRTDDLKDQACPNGVEDSREAYSVLSQATTNRERITMLHFTISQSLKGVEAAHGDLDDLLKSRKVTFDRFSAIKDFGAAASSVATALTSFTSEPDTE